MDLQGGCSCGNVRYEISGDLAGNGCSFCHCRTCQTSTGAPVVAWATFKQDSFKFVKGSEGIKTYRSSPTGVRKFCGACGTQLVCIISATDVGVTAASLDEPAFVNPTCHFYCRSQLPWLKIEDELPKYVDNGGKERGLEAS